MQKRELIAAQLKDTPEKSSRQITDGLKIDDKTVGKARDDLEQLAEIPHVSERKDSLGREQPSHEPNAIKTTFLGNTPDAAVPVTSEALVGAGISTSTFAKAVFCLVQRLGRNWHEVFSGQLASAYALATRWPAPSPWPVTAQQATLADMATDYSASSYLAAPGENASQARH